MRRHKANSFRSLSFHATVVPPVSADLSMETRGNHLDLNVMSF